VVRRVDGMTSVDVEALRSQLGPLRHLGMTSTIETDRTSASFFGAETEHFSQSRLFSFSAVAEFFMFTTTMAILGEMCPGGNILHLTSSLVVSRGDGAPRQSLSVGLVIRHDPALTARTAPVMLDISRRAPAP